MKRKTSIIIITYNNLNYTKDCIQSIYQYTNPNSYEIIIVDNASNDGTRSWLKQQKNLKIIFNEHNLGFPKGCNQAVEIAEKTNDILLLNNDTIVTENWLENLKTALNSDIQIGAVGAICNHNENLQGCDFHYETLDEMQKLAKENNVSDASRWEEKVFLIGFCLLIKREVINKIRSLDENYSPGYIEDNDLSLKISSLGYRLLLCHDCFIHHYLGTAFRKDLTKFYPILLKNRQYFEKKWGFSTFAFDEVKEASFKLIEKPQKVLELDCGIGVTALKLRYLYKNIVITGVEQDPKKRKIAKKFIKVYSSLFAIEKNTYDYILIGTLLEKIKNPQKFIANLRKYLTNDGYVIGEIHNAASLKNILLLLNDSWYFEQKNQRNFFTVTDICKLFSEQSYKNQFIFSWYKSLDEEEMKAQELLYQLIPKNYKNVYYTFRFQK